MRFGKNNVLYLICMNFGGYKGPYMVHRTFFVYYKKKTEKVQEHDLYLNKILHHFELIYFSRMNNKILRKGGPAPISLQNEYSSSN